jgi:tetratricopeptide (TPR) repeat protein
MDDATPPQQPEQPPATTSIGRDQHNISHSPGAIPGSVSGDVSQNYGQQHNVNTGGAPYNEIHYHGVTGPLPAHPAALQAAYGHLARLPLDTVPQVGMLPPGSRMPLGFNRLFVGRESEFVQLAAALKAGGAAAIAPLAATTGMGGIGKTQLAAEVTHRYGQYFAGGVFWMSFASADSVPAEIAACGGPGAMSLPAFSSLSLDGQVAAVIQTWQSSLPRLLIFDNCEEEALLEQWRPKSGGCRVLITSRRGEWDPSFSVATLPLATLPRPQSIALLRKFRPDLSEADPDLAAIADELGDLPLALHLAGSFLRQFRADTSPTDYLAELQSGALLEHESLQGLDLVVSPTNHDLHVGRTFALSYERLDHTKTIDALALELLARAAYFAPGEPIPRDLLATVKLADDPAARRRATRAIHRLRDLGLLDVETDDALRLHRLIGAFVRSLASDDAGQVAVEEAVFIIANRLNREGYPAPLLALHAHLRYVIDAAMVREDERAARLCSAMDYCLSMVGDYTGARPYSEYALQIHQQIFGSKHPSTAICMNNLGILLADQGDLLGAHFYYEEALAIWKMLGNKHSDTALTLNNLGVLFANQGDLRGAHFYYEQALAIWKMLGNKHSDTALTMNNLGVLLVNQGYRKRARVYYEQALAIWKVLGNKHPDTALTMNNLGKLLAYLGDLKGARSYYEQALAIYERALGSNHPSTRIVRYNLDVLSEKLRSYRPP